MKPHLYIIDLKGNACIDKYPKSIKEVQSLLPEITAQCGFDEEPAVEKILPINCGRVFYPSDRIISGNETVQGKWPFLVALITASNRRYFCGGNLISSKHVLTAAHCILAKYQNKQKGASEIAVLLGQNDIEASLERGSEQRYMSEIVMHPNWDNSTDKYDYDLALLVLDREVQFSEYIQPVCLTSDPAIMDHFDGTVVCLARSLNAPL